MTIVNFQWSIVNNQFYALPHTLPSGTDLEQKFCRLVAPVLGMARTSALVEMILQFERIAEVRELIGLCGV